MQLGFLLILITKKISLLIQLQFIIELNKINNRKYFENYIIYIVNHSRFFNLLFIIWIKKRLKTFIRQFNFYILNIKNNW